MAMESPLIKKIQTRQTEFAAQWQDIAQFMLQLDGVTMDSSDITVLWKRPESIQPYTEAQTRQLSVNTGIPLITLLRRDGWTEAEIESMRDDKAMQDKAQKTMAQALLADLKIKQQQQDINADSP